MFRSRLAKERYDQAIDACSTVTQSITEVNERLAGISEKVQFHVPANLKRLISLMK